jgi:hypothetical protein
MAQDLNFDKDLISDNKSNMKDKHNIIKNKTTKTCYQIPKIGKRVNARRVNLACPQVLLQL